jgi:hypothetical protein
VADIASIVEVGAGAAKAAETIVVIITRTRKAFALYFPNEE